LLLADEVPSPSIINMEAHRSVTMTPRVKQERAERQARIERAKASVRLEGLEPTHAATLIFDRYVFGELTIEQMGTEIRALNAREFGPVHVSVD
jgi:hypothetical protein